MPVKTISKFPALRYPANLGTNEAPVYVRFTPQQVQYGAVTGFKPAANVPPNLSRGINIGATGVSSNPLQQLQSQIGGIVDNVANAAKQSLTQINNIFQSGDIGSAVGTVLNGRVQLRNSTITFGGRTDQDKLKTQGSISLYLPDNLTNNLTANYTAEQLGAVGYEAVAGVQRITSQADKIDALKKTGEGIVKGAFSDLFASSGKLTAITAASVGKVVNPYSYQIFNGMQHRQFQYDFRLVPRNAGDSKVIKAVCDTFMYWMLPAKAQDADFHFFDIPCQWKIEYQRLGNPIEFLQSPGACFLANVGVRYNPEGNNHTHTDGAPVAVDLSLSFLEIEPLYRAKAAELEEMGSNPLVNINELLTPNNSGTK